MADATGHMDWPGAGPFTTQMMYGGTHANYYVHPDDETRNYLIIKTNPPGTKDSFVKGGFSDIEAAHVWLASEIRSGRLAR